MNVYKISITTYDEDNYHIFVSDQKLSQKEFIKLVKEVFKITYERNFEKWKKDDRMIDWHYILDESKEIFKEKGFDYVEPIAYQNDTFLFLVDSRSGKSHRENDKNTFDSVTYKKIIQFNKKMGIQRNERWKKMCDKIDEEKMKEQIKEQEKIMKEYDKKSRDIKYER